MAISRIDAARGEGGGVGHHHHHHHQGDGRRGGDRPGEGGGVHTPGGPIGSENSLAAGRSKPLLPSSRLPAGGGGGLGAGIRSPALATTLTGGGGGGALGHRGPSNYVEK